MSKGFHPFKKWVKPFHMMANICFRYQCNGKL